MDNERMSRFYDALFYDGIMTRNFEISARGISHVVEGSAKVIAKLMLCSGSFRKALLSNDLIYYNGMLYSSDAFIFDNNQIILSDDAKMHPEMYCLMRQAIKYSGSEMYLNPEPIFDISRSAMFESSYYYQYQSYGGINPAFIFAPGPETSSNNIDNHRTPKQIEWNSTVFSVATENRKNKFNRSTFESYMNKVRDLPDDFGGALQAFIAEANKSQEDVAFEANMSARNISRLINNKQQPKLETVIALCISLHLFPLFSEYLITSAGYSLRNSEEGLAYQLLINQFYMEDLYFCNNLLRQIGLKPLTDDPLSEMR